MKMIVQEPKAYKNQARELVTMIPLCISKLTLAFCEKLLIIIPNISDTREQIIFLIHPFSWQENHFQKNH